MLSSKRLLAIVEIQNEVATTALDPDAVMALVARRAQDLTEAAGAVIERAEGHQLIYHVGSGSGAPLVGLRVSADASLSGMCMRLGEVLYCRDADADPRVDGAAARRMGAVSMLCVPLSHETRMVGVLTVFASAPDAFDGEDVETLSVLSGLVSAQMAHAGEFQRHVAESRQDLLTGLPNRRAFEERLGSEVARARRHGDQLSLCLLDLEGFRLVNDSFGQAVGDEVLRAVAKHLAGVRGEDSAFRVGGDEFAVIFAGAGGAGAATAAERLEASVMDDQGCGGVGICWGVAELDGGDPAALLARADAELRRLKRSRRQG